MRTKGESCEIILYIVGSDEKEHSVNILIIISKTILNLTISENILFT